VEHGDLEALRRHLASRKGMCWDRLEDAVSELWALHEVDEATIVARVLATIDSEQASADAVADL